MPKNHETVALLAFTSDPIRAEQTLKKLLEQTKSFCSIMSVSSVYKSDSRQQTNQRSELVMVAKVRTTLSQRELSLNISNVKTVEGGVTSQAILLSLNREILMTPGLTLPDPRLVQDRLILQCAAEVWGQYEHPILGQTLTELVKLYPARDPVEFFSQGTYLY